MRNIKKVLLIFALVFSISALTACSGGTFDSVQANFEDEGYHAYDYKNPIAVNFDPERPETDGLVASQIFAHVDNMTIDLIDNYSDLETFTSFNFNVYLIGYYQTVPDAVQINKSAIIIEFASQEQLEEAMAVSDSLQAYYDGKDMEYYRRDNLLLIIRTVAYEDEIIEIFNRTAE
ncbi:MAG: hypothetical protein PF513_06040 [Tenericutes bacterium]|nr:hypothetical protein [Mycoplasmatota bacterium]